MSTVGPKSSAFVPIAHAHLHRLAAIAAADGRSFSPAIPIGRRTTPTGFCSSPYARAPPCTTCVVTWASTFSTSTPSTPPTPTSRGRRAGAHTTTLATPPLAAPLDRPQYIRCRVDVMGRSLPVAPDADPIAAVQAHLRSGQTATARFLAQKAAPAERLGQVVWPEG
jgi:hypothetical protein